jgi:hypothetical protein
MKKIVSSAIGSLSLLPFLAQAQRDLTVAPQAVGVGSLTEFYQLIKDITSWIVVFGILIGAVFIIWGGIQYMTSGGDESATGAAKQKIIAGLIGIALVLLAYGLVNVVASFLGAGPVVS